MAKAKATDLTAEELAAAKEGVAAIDQQALGWTNLLRLRRQANKEAKEEAKIAKEIAKLGAVEAANAKKNVDLNKELVDYEKKIAHSRAAGDSTALAYFNNAKKAAQDELAANQKTIGGRLKMKEVEARQARASLTAERELIKGINKERGVGGRIADLFRTKEAKARRNELAQIKAGGTGAGGGGGGKGGGGGAAGDAGGGGKGGKAVAGGLLAALGLAGIVAAFATIKAKFAGLGKMAAGVGGAMKSGLNAPLQSAAALISGESLGMGGGAVSGAGATSMLGGLQSMLSTIPLIGGMLGGLTGAFKGIVDAVLGIDQANMKVARTLNISAKEAEAMRASFKKAADASGNIAVNETRMLQSQVEIGNRLGINQKISTETLINDVKLRDILGMEVDSRQAIIDSQTITGRKATEITKSVIGQVGAFNKMVGTSFKFSAILSEASKLSGVMGLTFSKYPEKILRATMGVKTMGLEMANLNGISDSLLDFESSISKEMEAQVLTGMDLNLTKAREAALNNDYLGLSKEITKNVGSIDNFLGMNKIRQEGIAAAVGMTADSLADVLKKQKLYTALSATDLKTAQAKIALMEKEKGGREKIVALIGEAGYAQISEVSTAEKLAEVMEKIKRSFVDFLTKSGLFDFITNPEKVDSFVKTLTERLAGMVQVIGDIIASLLDTVGSITGFFGGDKAKYTGLADQVRYGTGLAAGGISSISNSLGGTPAESVGGTVEKGATQKAGASAPAATSGQPYGVMAPQPIIVQSILDGQVLATSTARILPQVYG